MKHFEYALSVIVAALVLGGAIAWTHATQPDERAMSCRPGTSSPAFVMKGMSVYPRCAPGKRG